LCLQNSKASGIGNRCHKLRPSEIRPHRGNHYWSSDSEAFTKPSLQHATSLTSLRLREKYRLTNHTHDDSAGFGRSISGCPGGGREFGDSTDWKITQARQDGTQILADRDFEPPAHPDSSPQQWGSPLFHLKPVVSRQSQ
jgi:hypothetical protein